MYLSPLSVKTKHARVGSFTTCLGCPSGAKTWRKNHLAALSHWEEELWT